MMGSPKIKTSHVYPAIPIRNHDWFAYDDTYDGAEDAGPQIVGHGATEAEAVSQFLALWNEKRVEESLSDAETAFWAKFAEHYPEARGGDLDPLYVFELSNANQKAVDRWLALNVEPAEEISDHVLTIHSLHDGQASCSCDGWTFATTGEATKEHIQSEWQMHVSTVRRLDAVLSGSTLVPGEGDR